MQAQESNIFRHYVSSTAERDGMPFQQVKILSYPDCKYVNLHMLFHNYHARLIPILKQFLHSQKPLCRLFLHSECFNPQQAVEHSYSLPPSLSILSNIQFQQGMFYNAIAIIFYPLCGGRWGLFSKRRWLHFAFSRQRKNMFLHTRIPGDFGEIKFLSNSYPNAKS